MNPDDTLTYPAFLTPWIVCLAEAGDVEGLARLFSAVRAITEASR